MDAGPGLPPRAGRPRGCNDATAAASGSRPTPRRAAPPHEGAPSEHLSPEARAQGAPAPESGATSGARTPRRGTRADQRASMSIMQSSQLRGYVHALPSPPSRTTRSSRTGSDIHHYARAHLPIKYARRSKKPFLGSTGSVISKTRRKLSEPSLEFVDVPSCYDIPSISSSSRRRNSNDLKVRGLGRPDGRRAWTRTGWMRSGFAVRGGLRRPPPGTGLVYSPLAKSGSSGPESDRRPVERISERGCSCRAIESGESRWRLMAMASPRTAGATGRGRPPGPSAVTSLSRPPHRQRTTVLCSPEGAAGRRGLATRGS